MEIVNNVLSLPILTTKTLNTMDKVLDALLIYVQFISKSLVKMENALTVIFIHMVMMQIKLLS